MVNKNYEIVLLIHPDQSDQVVAMVQRYINLIQEQGGQLHRHEDWGRRQLAYPINKLTKAHYVLLNVSITQQTLSELNDVFRYNDAIMRSLILKVANAITEPSVVMKERDTRAMDSANVPSKTYDA